MDIFTGYKVQLTTIEMAKAAVSFNLQLFQHMNFQKKKYYYEVYMHINGNILVEY